MSNKLIIKKTEEFVKKTMKGDPGHDWSHADRVRKAAVHIAKKEKADLFVVELAALLHDIADWKFYKDSHTGTKISRSWLTRNKVAKQTIDKICYIIDNSGWHKNIKLNTIEGQIIQDSDMLDAIGAIGIARTFSYGGFRNRPIYTPNSKLSHSTINHFYEKLLLLKDRMHTKTAKRIAVQRHKFIKIFLKEFYKEWNGV